MNNENEFNQNLNNESEIESNLNDAEISGFEQNEDLNEKKKDEEKNSWYWLIVLIVAIIIFIIILLLLHACNGVRSRNKSKIVETSDWVTNMWNKCVDPVFWYTVDGTGVNGKSIDIDSVLTDCDTYYNEYKEKNQSVLELSDEYSDFKELYKNISEQIDIIYPKIKANKPVAKENVDYEKNMETMYENQKKLYNLVKEKYSKG